MWKCGWQVRIRTLCTNLYEKVFPCNPYTVTNIDDVWEMDLADLSSLSKYDKYKYLWNVIDIFSRYKKDKTGTSITTALKSLFQNRKPIVVQSDKCIN